MLWRLAARGQTFRRVRRNEATRRLIRLAVRRIASRSECSAIARNSVAISMSVAFAKIWSVYRASFRQSSAFCRNSFGVMVICKTPSRTIGFPVPISSSPGLCPRPYSRIPSIGEVALKRRAVLRNSYPTLNRNVRCFVSLPTMNGSPNTLSCAQESNRCRAERPPGPSRAEAGRRVAQSTPFARRVATNRAQLLRMRFLWTGYLSARHDFWPRPLSVGTHPIVTPCKANTGKTPRFLRFTEPCDKCGVGQLAMTRPDSAV